MTDFKRPAAHVQNVQKTIQVSVLTIQLALEQRWLADDPERANEVLKLLDDGDPTISDLIALAREAAAYLRPLEKRARASQFWKAQRTA